MIRIACIAAGIALALPAQAQDWRLMNAGNDDSIVFFDALSITGDGDLKSGDLLMVYPENRNGTDAFRFRMTVDCTQPRFRPEHIWLYDIEGNMTSSGEASKKWTETQGENGRRTTEIICGREALSSRSFGSALPIREARRMGAK